MLVKYIVPTAVLVGCHSDHIFLSYSFRDCSLKLNNLITLHSLIAGGSVKAVCHLTVLAEVKL